MEEKKGYVEHIIYRNQENGYTVFEFVSQEEGEEYLDTCVGTFPFINEGEYLTLYGDMVTHPTYHEQFKVQKSESRSPDDALSMQRYLASGAIKGIGGGLAKRIVDKFGDETFNIIEKEPERLSEVKGISEKKAMDIAEQFEEKREMRNALLFLQQYGISNQLAVKIYKTYKEDLYGIFKTNPYRLAEDIRGVGFRIADNIAMKSGLDRNSDFRIRAGILYVLTLATASGHIYLPNEELYRHCIEFLGVSVEQLMHVQEEMEYDKSLMRDGEKVYLPSLYYGEMNCARMLLDIGSVTHKSGIDEERILEELQRKSDIHLDDRQRLAVFESLKNGLLVITGGPGTGKTTTINMIIKLLEEEGQSILLAAPTGRAAKRLSDISGFEAKTIHRLLEVKPTDGDNMSFVHDENNLLECDALIIDEMSMVDTLLFEAVLRGIKLTCKLVLVGDSDQLPSVGAGNVLKDIIESGVMPVVRLNEIFRQAQKSAIVTNAHKIVNGEHIDLTQKDNDFFFMQRMDFEGLQTLVSELCKTRLPKAYGYSPFDDIQVLSPTKKGPAGTQELNKLLQQQLNPPAAGKSELKTPLFTYRTGDKVMQTRNDYDIIWKKRTGEKTESGAGIFNGDIGRITACNKIVRTLNIDFDGRECVYTADMLDNLELAYAITVHKSQGSEYDAVVLTVFGGYDKLYYRNLLYTAVTRAKKLLVIVGQNRRVNFMIDNNRRTLRYTCLKDLLKELNSHGSDISDTL